MDSPPVVPAVMSKNTAERGQIGKKNSKLRTPAGARGPGETFPILKTR